MLILLRLDSCSLCGTVLWWQLWGLAAFRSLGRCSLALQLPESQPGACLLVALGIPALLGTVCLPAPCPSPQLFLNFHSA